MSLKRYGWVVGVRQEKIDAYKELHAAVWPDVLAMIKACNIQNYTIFLRELAPGQFYLFSYLEYTGKNLAADLAKMADDETTQKWWTFCKPCQQPIATAKDDEWWADMEEVFHIE